MPKWTSLTAMHENEIQGSDWIRRFLVMVGDLTYRARWEIFIISKFLEIENIVYQAQLEI